MTKLLDLLPPLGTQVKKNLKAYPWSNPIGSDEGCIGLPSISQKVRTEAILISRSCVVGEGGSVTIGCDVPPVLLILRDETDVTGQSSCSSLF